MLKTFLLASLLSLGLLIPTATYAQSPAECEELRLACENKDALGERGQGNCRRYRETCGPQSPYCQELRKACLYKHQLGERGQGNCRRYRSECRGINR